MCNKFGMSFFKRIWGSVAPNSRYASGVLASTDPSNVSPRVSVIFLGYPEGSKALADSVRKIKRGELGTFVLPNKTQARLERRFGFEYKL